MCSPTRVLIAPMKTTPLNLNMVLPWMYGEAGGPMWPKKEWKDMYESVPTGNISGMGSKNTDLRQAKAHALYSRPYSLKKSPTTPTTPAPKVSMEQPPSSGSGSSSDNGKGDDIPPARIVKKTVPAPTVFWNDHLRMI